MALAYQRKPYGLILGTGDNVYYGDLPDRIDDVLYEPYGPLLNAGVAFRPVLGNHDTSNDDEIMPIWATLGMPNRYYSFVRGPVEFFALDSNNMDADQTEWLRDHLKCSDSRWQIVYFHHPLYSSGSHGSDIILREQIESILIEGGADIVFNGHDHDYERTTPQHDIVYVVTGAGAKVTSVGTSDFTVVSKAEQHFLLIEIDDDIMTVEAISDDSEVLDTFVVSPRIAQTPCASFTKGY